MKMNKLVLALGMGAALVAGAANAGTDTTAVTDQGHGKINFIGSIIDAPCSISADSATQDVNFGEISSAALANSGKSTPKDFEIKLENCALSTQKTVSVTFTGAASTVNKNNLGIVGTASGASIALTSGNGTAIELGKATAAQTLQNGTNDLLFSAYLQGDGASAPVAGDFASVADFTLAYQ